MPEVLLQMIPGNGCSTFKFSQYLTLNRLSTGHSIR